MPFQSKLQQRWMFWKYPAMAKRWAKETPNIKKLPEKKSVLESIKKRLKK
jgi:hypothetical protein